MRGLGARRSAVTRQSGFTVTEMMIVLVVAGIIATAAVPGFLSLIRSSRISTGAQQLHQALFLARSEAGKRGQIVAIQSNSNSASWEGGWTMYEDTDGDGTQDADEPNIRVGEALGGAFTLTASAPIARYRPSGVLTVAPTPVTFSLCDGNAAGEQGRRIVVAQTGRASVSELTCP